MKTLTLDQHRELISRGMRIGNKLALSVKNVLLVKLTDEQMQDIAETISSAFVDGYKKGREEVQYEYNIKT